MEAELMALAAAGATAFVQQMAADSWAEARDRMVSFFSRHRSGEADVIEGELETSREELTAALQTGDEQTALDVESEWRTRLRRTLQANPAAASELRAVLDELAPGEKGQQVTAVHNTISGGVQHGPVIQAGNVGSLHFGPTPGRG
jgi:PHD/YefM family antitoxin component YafN of YafNO toxin-antitoxin module